MPTTRRIHCALLPDQRHCRTKVAGFKVARAVFIIPGLPENAVGKIAKTELRKSI